MDPQSPPLHAQPGEHFQQRVLFGLRRQRRLWCDAQARDTLSQLAAPLALDLALKSADIEEATRLMSGLNTIPEGTSRFDWQLRQSRVLVLGGRYDEGNQVLQNLIIEYREPNERLPIGYCRCCSTCKP